jgi:hypothetical protein
MEKIKSFIGTFKVMLRLFKIICDGANIKETEVIKFFDKGGSWYVMDENRKLIKTSTWGFCKYLYDKNADFFWDKNIEGITFEWEA